MDMPVDVRYDSAQETDDMAIMDKIDRLKHQVLDAGGTFIRHSANGHAIYKLGTHQLTFPHRHLSKSQGHAFANLKQQVKRALAAAPPVAAAARDGNGQGLTAAEVDALRPEPAPRTAVKVEPLPSAPPPQAAPRTCRWCGATFKASAARGSHEQRMHATEFAAAGGSRRGQIVARYTDNTRHTCPWCDYQALSFNGLGVHAKRKHPKLFVRGRLVARVVPVVVAPVVAPVAAGPGEDPILAALEQAAEALMAARTAHLARTAEHGELATLRAETTKLRKALQAVREATQD